MTLIDLGDFKIRFDPKEVRISIDGDIIDVGARREDQLDFDTLEEHLTEQQKDVLAKALHYSRRR